MVEVLTFRFLYDRKWVLIAYVLSSTRERCAAKRELMD